MTRGEPVAQRADNYVRAALDRECESLANTTSGRNEALNRAAFALGQFLGEGLLDRSEVERRLEACATQNGYLAKDGIVAVRSTIRSGIEHGLREPRSTPIGDVLAQSSVVGSTDRPRPGKPAPKLAGVSFPEWTKPGENGRPKFFAVGKSEVGVLNDEMRRHVYYRDGEPIRIKVKKRPQGDLSQWTTFYRVRRPSDGALGWQAKQPAAYVPMAYFGPPGSPNPFNADVNEPIFWPEGERDVDTLVSLGLMAFTFGSSSDVPAGMDDLARDRDIIVVADNDEAGRKCLERKLKAIAGKARRVQSIEFDDLPVGGDVSDWFAAGRSDTELLDRAKDVQEQNSNGAANGGDGLENDDLITEKSAAEAFVARYCGHLRFDHDVGSWFEWTGAHWRRDRTCVAFDLAGRFVQSLVNDKADRVRYVSSRAAFAGSVERFARADRQLAVATEFWDRNPFLLGTPAGTIDLRSGETYEADPLDGISKSTAVSAADSADCPLWIEFLQETTGGDAGLVRFLQQFLGYALTGDVREHVLLFGHGPGGNGKSVFLNTAANIMGDYAVTAAMDTFAAGTGDKHPTELAMLRGARLVTASETEEGRSWAEARIKQITGGDLITARFMRQDFFTFAPTFKLFLIGNHKPVLHNVDEAARRRFCIVPFTRKPSRPDRLLEKKIEAEWPAILRWMVEGCVDWQTNGLLRPAVVAEATSEYFGMQDILGQFLEEECDCDPGNDWKKTPSGELFEAWTKYAKAAGEDAKSQKSFSEELKRRGFTLDKGSKGRRYTVGIRLLPPPSATSGAHYDN